MSSGLPDFSCFWTAARAAVQKALEDAEAPQPPATLFLRLHYPFFDDEVQKLLMQRHPESPQIKSGVPAWYPVEAYIIAEQYAWAYYTNDGLNNLDMIEGAAQYCFVFDLPWFARLLVAITDAIKKAAAVSPATVTLKLQGWNNQYSQADKTPGRWLARTEELEKKKEISKSPLNSTRVLANKENSKRKTIFQSWLPCWKAELAHLTEDLKNDSEQKIRLARAEHSKNDR